MPIMLVDALRPNVQVLPCQDLGIAQDRAGVSVNLTKLLPLQSKELLI